MVILSIQHLEHLELIILLLTSTGGWDCGGLSWFHAHVGGAPGGKDLEPVF